jgi:cellulose synthase/poly-beta-1,6-N-acetylglucosamine synthase-like glycosyltransferase
MDILPINLFACLLKSLFIMIFCLLILISYLNLSFKLKTNKESRKLEIYFKLCNRGQLIKKKKFKFKQHPKISIISPIYNRAKFILRFLRSIQNQFYEDLEIIFVDDFSTDNSVKMIEKYQREDERIILLKHKKNKGTFNN